MAEVVLYGAAYSVYVRIARLALEEKGVAYRLEEVDIFAEGGPPSGYLARHPFGRIPAFAHGDFELYETTAIVRYVDEAFDGPALQSVAPKARARMNQITSLLDSYAYRTLVWDILVERVIVPEEGGRSDEAKIAAAIPRARACLSALEDLMGTAEFLAGDALTLADLQAASMIACFRQAPEGVALMADHPALSAWWDRMAVRPSMAATRPPREQA
jgi:glutathione S-transferase